MEGSNMDSDKQQRTFQGRIDLSQIKTATPNDDLKKAQMFVRVVAMDLDRSADDKKFPVVVGDSTTVMKCSVAGRHYSSVQRAFCRDTTLSITDFMVAKEVVYVSERTTVMRCPESVCVTPELKSQGMLLLEKPNTVEAIKASPLKTRVSLKGKIVKVKPMHTVKIRRTGEDKELINARVKDRTGIIPISLWGKTATKHKSLKPGDCVSIERAERGVFENKPTPNTWEDSTTIEMIPDDLQISSLDDEASLAEPLLPAGMTHGEWQSIGNIESYPACSNSRCFLKKLSDNICNTCLTDYTSSNTETVAYIATAGIKLPGSTSLKTVRMFTQVLRQAYTQMKPGLALPTDPQVIEDELFEQLPKMCSFKLNANNVLTYLHLL